MSATTQLDANQVIKRVYDEDTGALKVTGPSPIVSNLSSDTDSIALGDVTASNFLEVNAAGQASVQTNPAVIATTTWLDEVDAADDQTTSEVNCLAYRVVGVMANWEDLDQTDATLQFQGSFDNIIWDDLGSATTISTPTDHQGFSLIDEPYELIRLVYNHGTNTTGTLTVKYLMRA